MKKKIIAIALALCMVTALLPATVLAASDGEPLCTAAEGCTLAAGHEGACVLAEAGGEPADAACTATDGCTLAAGHEGACVLAEAGGEPADAACTATEGCTLAAGHEGACVLAEAGGEPADAACTVTEGCTLAAGHEGACVLAEAGDAPADAPDGGFVVRRRSVVYAGGAGASDNNTGADADNAVATLAKALEIVEDGGTIMVRGHFYTNDALTLENVTLKRADGFTGKMLYVKSGTLTLQNMTIDGRKDTVDADEMSALVTVGAGAVLNIGEGAALKDNGAMAVYAMEGAAVNMTGGVISGNENATDGAAIMAYGCTVNLTGGEITANSSERAGGGVCFLGAGTVMLDGTKITGNSAIRGGGVYIEGMDGDATFVMTGGEITGNRLNVDEQEEEGEVYYLMLDGAGICAWYGAYSQNVVLDIRGGVISGNIVTDELAENIGYGSAISLNRSEDENNDFAPYGYPELRLSGSPAISGDIFLWDAELYGADGEVTGTGPAFTLAEGFAPAAPLAVDANYMNGDTEAVQFPAGMAAAEAEALFRSVNERYMLAADGQTLKWLKLMRVVFKTQNNADTYKTVYLRPGTAIDPALAPVEGGAEGVAAPAEGYVLAGWVRYNGNALWDFATDLVDDRSMSLLAVWGPDAPAVTLAADRTVVHAAGSFTLTAAPSHPLDDITYNYAWYRDGQLVDGETAATLTTDEPGSYTVQVTATRGRLTSAATESGAVVCTVTAHAPAAAWSADGAGHWHVCGACGEKLSQGAHTFGEWHTTLAPTATKTGVQEKNCTVCGYGVCATVPATGTSTPQTGDTFPVWLFAGLLCVGTAGLAAVTAVRLRGSRKRGGN